MTEITVLRPDEEAPLAEELELAPRQDPPGRPTIGLVANGKPLAKELLSVLAQEIAAELGREVDTVLVQKASAAYQVADAEADRLAAECDFVITGLGDCGACSTCSLYDAVSIERRGTPATVLITEPFTTLIASLAAKLGAPGYHSLSLPHPVWGKDEDEQRALARSVVSAALAQLVAPVVAMR